MANPNELEGRIVGGNRIVLTGLLDGSRHVSRSLASLFRDLRNRRKLIIQAEDVVVVPEGIPLWIGAVKEFLLDCRLEYCPSHLAVVLRFDSEYDHAKTEYLEHTESQDCVPARDVGAIRIAAKPAMSHRAW